MAAPIRYKPKTTKQSPVPVNPPMKFPTTNPKFDDRMYAPLPWAGPIKRGRITEEDPPGPYVLNFLYNPVELSFEHSFNPTMRPPDSTMNVATLGEPGGTMLSFSLLFVRQYEVAYNGDTDGVLTDIRVLQGLTGMFRQDIKMADNAFMWQKRLRFNFGDLINFTGYIHSMSYGLQFFNERMVPMAAEVSISATYLPPTIGIVGAVPPAMDVTTGLPTPITAPQSKVLPAKRTGPAQASIW